MKRVSLIILAILFLFNLNAIEKRTVKRIKKYSGRNAKLLLNWEKSLEKDTKEYASFLLDNASPNDLAILTPELLTENIELAIQTKTLPYAADIPDNIFKHFVLPHRVSQEPLEPWRKQFYEDIQPLVKDETDIAKAITIVNLWCAEMVYFKQTHGRDQAPLTSFKRGYGRCEEGMIMVIAAARAVGIPCRTASVPYWNFSDSNHAWVEVWTPDGWEYIGESENSLSRTWFSKTTERATMVNSRVYGNFYSPDAIRQENNVTLINNIKYYTDFDYCTVTIKDEKGKPVEDAKVSFLAASFGGLFTMAENQTDNKGKVSLPLGKSSCYVLATKDNLLASGVLNTIKSTKLKLTLQENVDPVSDVTLQFLLSNKNPNPNAQTELLGDEFYKRREIRNLKREKRMLSEALGSKYAKFYDLAYLADEQDSLYFSNREEFMKKSDEIAGNSENFLNVLEVVKDENQKVQMLVKMIELWDIKELCEIADSTSIYNVTNIYSEAKTRFENVVPDSIFDKGVISFSWRSFTPPQNGWQQEFYNQIKPLANESIVTTTSNVIDWVDECLNIDEEFYWSYFSGSLNPVQILNQKNTNESYRMVVLNCALKLLGVPVIYVGRLEYFNGSEFVEVEPQPAKVEPETFETLITLLIDGEIVKAEPWSNFLIASLEDGSMGNTWFDGEAEGSKFRANYRIGDEQKLYIQAYARNGNGDANIQIVPLNGEAEITVELTTPKEYLDNSAEWKDETIVKLNTLLNNADFGLFYNRSHISDPIPYSGKTIIFITAGVAIEPEQRMLTQLETIANELYESGTGIIMHDENSNPYETTNLKRVIGTSVYGNILHGEVNQIDYPVIFIFDNEKQKVIDILPQDLLFSTHGYNMGLGDLILKKLK